MFGKHNIFRNKRRKMKLESSLFPLTSAYIDLIDDRNNYRIHYTVKSEHK